MKKETISFLLFVLGLAGVVFIILLVLDLI